MKRACSVEGCRNEGYTDLCRKHYDQKIHGRGIYRDFSKGRRPKDPNEFRIKGDVCFISLYDKLNRKKAEAVIDAEDYKKCKPYKWTGYISRYTMSVVSNKVGHLANFIMNFKPTSVLIIDHIDGNGLICQKKNLRVCSTQQNQLKKRKQRNNTSGYRGVTWYVNPGKTSRWLAQIYYNYQRYHLGYFDTKEEAALAYNTKAIELFGEFAVLNQIERS
jgi:hypothetical protein